MNSKLGANFDERNFKSQCMWNQSTSTYDVSLVSQDNQTVTVRDLELEIAFRKGEFMNISTCAKFTIEGIADELVEVGLDVVAWYTDKRGHFAEILAAPCSRKS